MFPIITDVFCYFILELCPFDCLFYVYFVYTNLVHDIVLITDWKIFMNFYKRVYMHIFLNKKGTYYSMALSIRLSIYPYIRNILVRAVTQ